jgi:hypothetical protein
MEDYLIDTCGPTWPQAIKAYTKLSHLVSPANPDAVLTFLTGLSLSTPTLPPPSSRIRSYSALVWGGPWPPLLSAHRPQALVS